MQFAKPEKSWIAIVIVSTIVIAALFYLSVEYIENDNYRYGAYAILVAAIIGVGYYSFVTEDKYTRKMNANKMWENYVRDD